MIEGTVAKSYKISQPPGGMYDGFAEGDQPGGGPALPKVISLLQILSGVDPALTTRRLSITNVRVTATCCSVFGLALEDMHEGLRLFRRPIHIGSPLETNTLSKLIASVKASGHAGNYGADLNVDGPLVLDGTKTQTSSGVEVPLQDIQLVLVFDQSANSLALSCADNWWGMIGLQFDYTTDVTVPVKLPVEQPDLTQKSIFAQVKFPKLASVVKRGKKQMVKSITKKKKVGKQQKTEKPTTKWAQKKKVTKKFKTTDKGKRRLKRSKKQSPNVAI